MKVTISGMLVTTIVTMAVLTTVFGQHQRSKRTLKPQPISAAGGALSEGFLLFAHLDKGQVKSGEPIVLKLAVKNATNGELILFESSAVQDYKLTVKNGKGESIPLTDAGVRILSAAGEHLRQVMVKVGPGQERHVSLIVNDLYRMTTGGTYYITARREVPRQSGQGTAEVVSNTIKIVVTN